MRSVGWASRWAALRNSWARNPSLKATPTAGETVELVKGPSQRQGVADEFGAESIGFVLA